jgi:ABC-2 type transport system ATP-binding protein
MMNVIEVRSLHKAFGRTRALNGLDLTVRAGEVHAFLGPNGAGKTTTIRILLGLLKADTGQATLPGGDPWHDAVELHRRLAYVRGPAARFGRPSGLAARIRTYIEEGSEG